MEQNPLAAEAQKLPEGPEVEEPIDMSWPETFYKQCVYVAVAPILYPLYCTLPDVKKPVRRKNSSDLVYPSLGAKEVRCLHFHWLCAMDRFLLVPHDLVGAYDWPHAGHLHGSDGADHSCCRHQHTGPHHEV